MRVEYLASYDRSFKKLAGHRQADTIDAVDRLLDYFATGQRPYGLGLKRLQHRYWEIRIGLDTRLLFELQADRLTFVLVGNHDDIRRAIRRL